MSKVTYDKSLSADIAIFTVHDDALKILLVKRAHAPYEDFWALPGGFRQIGVDSSIEDIATRRFKEETGVDAPYLEQLYTFGSIERDPRGWVTTVAYFAFMPYNDAKLMAGKGVSDVKWFIVKEGGVNAKLAFDHEDIVLKAIDRVKSKMDYTCICAHALGDRFTIPQLQKAYEVILEESLDKAYFRRAIQETGILEKTSEKEDVKGHKPAILYRFVKGADKKLFFPRGIKRASQGKQIK